MKPVAERAVIIGAGLIGSSLGAAAKAAGAFRHVVGVGRDARNLAVALERACVDSVSQDPLSAVVKADLVILATPVDTAVELLPSLAAVARGTTIFTDVGSVKQPIVRAARQCGIEARFVGGHPIAGGTAVGATACDPGMFRDRTVVLTPGPGTSPEASARVRILWEATGARIIETTAERHDEALALTSHLPQFLAYALCVAAERGGDLTDRFFGAGFRDTTRLAASDHDLWIAVARLNAGPLLKVMDAFGEVWGELRAAVAAGDEAALRRILRQASAGKDRSER